MSLLSRTVRLLVTLDLDEDDDRPTSDICDDVQRQLSGDAAEVAVIAATDDSTPRSPDPTQAVRDADLTAYLAAVVAAMAGRDPGIADYLSPVCPECGQLGDGQDGRYVVLGAAVVVGCEGYWVINPTRSASPGRTGNPSPDTLSIPLPGSGPRRSGDLKPFPGHGCIAARPRIHPPRHACEEAQMTTPDHREVPDPHRAPFADLVAELDTLGFDAQPVEVAPNRTRYTATDSPVTVFVIAHPGTARARVVAPTARGTWYLDWTPDTPVHVQLITLYAVLNDNPAAALGAAAAALGVTPAVEPTATTLGPSG